ncbi:hypothetical protein ACFL5O_01360 [Myxococcota bacterium]
MLEPRRAGGVEQGASDGGNATGEEASTSLETHPADVEGAVAADPAVAPDGERIAEFLLGEVGGLGGSGLLVDLGGRLAEERGVGARMVVAIDEGEEPDLHLTAKCWGLITDGGTIRDLYRDVVDTLESARRRSPRRP